MKTAWVNLRRTRRVLILWRCDRQPGFPENRDGGLGANYGDLRNLGSGYVNERPPGAQLFAKIGISGLECAPVSA